MKKFWIVLAMCSVVLSGVAAQPAQAADKTIYIVFDNGAASVDAGHVRERGQIGGFMDQDLVRVFARYSKQGYEAQLIEKAARTSSRRPAVTCSTSRSPNTTPAARPRACSSVSARAA